MTHLTYADRERLIAQLDGVVADWEGSDEELLCDALELTKSFHPSYGFERALVRDITQLSRYLTLHGDSPDIVMLCRGALLHAVGSGGFEASAKDTLKLVEVAFVCRYAVHEVGARLGESGPFELPALTIEERSVAETMFLDLTGEAELSDDGLVEKVDEALEELGGLKDSSIFQRFARQIHYLKTVLQGEESSQEHRGYARAALQYFICEEDAIDDRLGPVGLIDDCFIAQLATDLVNPECEPWAELLDEAAMALPHLRNLFLDDGGEVQLPSEYDVVNAAVASPRLAEGGERQSVIVTSWSGPTPFLIGFSSAVGIALKEATSKEPPTFRIGQKVRVDQTSVAEFAGYEELPDGRKMFKLRTYRQERRERLQSVRSWPISEISRLSVADSRLKTRGKLTASIKHSDSILPGLAYLQPDGVHHHDFSSMPRVLVVGSVAACRRYADSLLINGQPLREVLPMGHLGADRESVVRWSTRLSRAEPLLVFASDVDAASEYVADADGEFEQVIVDATEQNSQRLASMKYLRRATRNLVVVTNERSVSELLAENDSVWEWTDQDFRGLVWPADSGGPKNGMLRANASRLRKTAANKPTIRQVSLSQATDALAAYRQLQRSARERGDDSLATLDESVAVGFRWLSLNLRCCYVPSSNGDWERAVSQYDSAIRGLVRRTAFLTDVERDAIAAMQSSLRAFDASIREGSPKAAAVSEELGRRRGAKLYCLDSRLTREACETYAEQRVVATPDTNVADDGAVVAGWYNRKRMEKLLCPAFTDPLFLVLYDCEYRWWAGFEREREQAREQRRASSDRSKVFPQIRGWRPQGAFSAASRPDVGGEPGHISSGHEEEPWGVSTSDLLREHAPTASEDSVPARWVSFTDGSYGLFTESYKLNTVTRLLDTPGEEDVKLDRLEVARLQEGDAVLFSTSGQDAIREVADTLLPSGIRAIASLWRDALVEYCESTNTEPEE